MFVRRYYLKIKKSFQRRYGTYTFGYGMSPDSWIYCNSCAVQDVYTHITGNPTIIGVTENTKKNVNISSAFLSSDLEFSRTISLQVDARDYFERIQPGLQKDFIYLNDISSIHKIPLEGYLWAKGDLAVESAESKNIYLLEVKLANGSILLNLTIQKRHLSVFYQHISEKNVKVDQLSVEVFGFLTNTFIVNEKIRMINLVPLVITRSKQ
jgi:hypothetical protein